MRILFLSPYVPSLIRVRPYHWVRSLVGLGHEVHLVALQPPDDMAGAADEMRQVCAAVDLFPLTRRRTLTNAAFALPRRATPLQLAYSHHPEAERHVARLAATGRYDIVHIEHMRGVALSSHVRGVPIVYDAVDSISALFAETAQQAQSRGARWLARLDLERSRRFEARAPSMFSKVIVTSAREAAAFTALAGASASDRISVVSNGVDTDYFRPSAPDGQRAVLFTGKLSYHANAAAAVRLVTRIMPLVWARRPETPVILAGKDPPPELRAFAADHRIRVTGYLSDMRGVFGEGAIAVCPLVYGAGIQNKVLEALASGVATVMTSSAAQALSGIAGWHYVACDGDDEFAAAIIGLLEDEPRRRQLGFEGRQYVTANHRWDVLASRLVQVYEAAR